MLKLDKSILVHLETYKVITIKQAERIYFQNGEPDYRNDRARKKLKQMQDNGLLKGYENAITKEKVYYIDEKISAHDIYILDFYSKLHEYGCRDIVMEKEPRYLKGLIRPDALFKFVFDGDMFFTLLEVDLTHFTSMSKFQFYEKLYKEQELQPLCYGVFPQIVVMGVNTTRYNSKNFEVVYVDFTLNRFNDVLGLIL